MPAGPRQSLAQKPREQALSAAAVSNSSSWRQYARARGESPGSAAVGGSGRRMSPWRVTTTQRPSCCAGSSGSAEARARSAPGAHLDGFSPWPLRSKMKPSRAARMVQSCTTARCVGFCTLHRGDARFPVSKLAVGVGSGATVCGAEIEAGDSCALLARRSPILSPILATWLCAALVAASRLNFSDSTSLDRLRDRFLHRLALFAAGDVVTRRRPGEAAARCGADHCAQGCGKGYRSGQQRGTLAARRPDDAPSTSGSASGAAAIGAGIMRWRFAEA